jgi:hypothetical protein
MEQALVAETQPLSQVERVVDTFVAPSKTFTDILRSASWWLPLLLAFVITAASAFAIDHTIGFDRVSEQAISQSPRAEEQMAQLTPEARAQRIHISAIVTRYISYSAGIFFLIFGAFFALLNWAGINFGFGAKTTYAQNLAVGLYASLPRMVVALLNIVFVYAGVGTENYDMKNPVGTNLGYYMPDAAPWLKALATQFDVFALWSLVLTVIGTAIIAKKTVGQAAIVVVGWWAVTVLLIVGLTALTS